MNYFDRINVAAKRAGIEYKSGRESIKNHLLQFYNTLHDQNLAMQLRLTVCNDIDSLAEILEIHEQGQRHVNRAKGSNHSSAQFTKSDSNSFKNRSHGKNEISQHAKSGVHSMDNKQKTSRDNDRAKIVCDHCNKVGHVKANCFKLQECTFCKKLGHGTKYCLKRKETLMSTVEKLVGDQTIFNSLPTELREKLQHLNL